MVSGFAPIKKSISCVIRDIGMCVGWMTLPYLRLVKPEKRKLLLAAITMYTHLAQSVAS